MVKKIHYIWLGGKKKSKSIKRCIKSWAKFFPDWEIIEWNEKNLNIHLMPYVEQAYREKKYAFASDVFRFDILNKYGGLYFDVDVKVIKPFNDVFASCRAFSGFETDEYVAPGLVLYSGFPNNIAFQEMLNSYKNDNFILEDGSMNLLTVGQRFTKILDERGLIHDNTFQTIDGFAVFPKTYFNPMDYYGELSNFSRDTHSIHLYAASWLPVTKRIRRKISNTIHKIKKVIN